LAKKTCNFKEPTNRSQLIHDKRCYADDGERQQHVDVFVFVGHSPFICTHTLHVHILIFLGVLKKKGAMQTTTSSQNACTYCVIYTNTHQYLGVHEREVLRR